MGSMMRFMFYIVLFIRFNGWFVILRHEVLLSVHAMKLTLPSYIRVNMTMVGTLCSQIIRQKSSTELSVGPETVRDMK